MFELPVVPPLLLLEFMLPAVLVEPVAPAPVVAPVVALEFMLPAVPPLVEFMLLALPIFALSVVAQEAMPKVARAARLSRAKVRRIEVSPVLAEVKISNVAARVFVRVLFSVQTRAGTFRLQLQEWRA